MLIDLPESATSDEVRAAFRRLAKLCHPDLCTDKTRASVEFRELVSDMERRLQRMPPPPRIEPEPTVDDRPKRSYLVSIIVGDNARVENGVLMASVRVPPGITTIIADVFAQEGRTLTKDAANFQFSFTVPMDFEDDPIPRTLRFKNTPFECALRLWH